MERGIKKCVAYLDPSEFRSIWLGNKAVIALAGRLLTAASCVASAAGMAGFGEDMQNDDKIRKYGYCGRLKVLELFKDKSNTDLQENMGVAAHLIHGSSDGRFP